MKKKKLAVFALLTAFALSLFGCHDGHILDGSEQETVLPQEISIEIYERFLHYFTNN